MALVVTWETGDIFVPQADLTDLGGGRYELDVDAFRLELRALEASPEGMSYPPTHQHTGTQTLAGTTYQRRVLILPPYTVRFEPGSYFVLSVNGDNNIADVLTYTGVGFIPGNSAASTVNVVETGTSGLTAAESANLAQLTTEMNEMYAVHGLRDGDPMTFSDDSRSTQSGDIDQTITTDGNGDVTVTRNP